MKQKEKKNPLLFWGTIILIIVMCALIFVPMMTMRGTMADTVKQVNEKYNDEFTMTWSDIDDKPMSDTFIAIMKSNTTGITYDAHIKDGVVTIDDYEEENFNAKINDEVEATIANSFAMASAVDGVLTLRMFTTHTVTEDVLAQLATSLKEAFDLQTVKIETMQITETQLTEAQEQIGDFYQRSTVAAEETFDSYKPIRNEYNF